jgi:predicted dehydrogenase
MTAQTIGIIVNGATGRIASTQHLANALVPIIQEGGLEITSGRLLPRLLVVGRNPQRVASIARMHNIADWTCDLDAALSDSGYAVFFDAAATAQRVAALERAIAAGKHIYSEKPVAPSVEQGRALLQKLEARGLKHGVVEDKIFLPGLQNLGIVAKSGALGRIVGFRLEFGWWVFDGSEQPCQRPSWNYRTGGGLIIDMYPHWRYVIETIVGRIVRVASAQWIATPERVDEAGMRYAGEVDDSAATLVEIEGGVFGTILSSWATRVRRDDLFTLQLDGTRGSASAGLHRCYVQTNEETPAVAHFSIMQDIGADYRAGWSQAPPLAAYCNPYRVGWERFLRHISTQDPMPSDFRAGIRDVAFAEICQRSMAERRWIDVPPPS